MLIANEDLDHRTKRSWPPLKGPISILALLSPGGLICSGSILLLYTTRTHYNNKL